MSARTTSLWVTLLAATTLLAGCERPPVDSVQRGFRGTGMELVYNPRTELRVAAANQAPPVTKEASSLPVLIRVRWVPSHRIFQNSRLRAKASHWPSGDQKGLEAPSVWGISIGSQLSSRRM